MRWIVLALSLGATIVSLILGVLAIWQLVSGGGSGVASGSAFTWITIILLLLSAVISLLGGILAFNKRKIAGVFLVIAALICLFAHSGTRVFGWIYLAAGALAFVSSSFFGRSEEDYGEFEDEDEDDEDEDTDEEEESRERDVFRVRAGSGRHDDNFSVGGKRKERASKIKLDREEYSLSGDGISKMAEPFRARTLKVCPACGASVGIEHKFCYICGNQLQSARPLHESHVADADSVGLSANSAPSVDSPSVLRDFQMVSPLDGSEPSRNEAWWQADDKVGGKTDGSIVDNSQRSVEEEDLLDEVPEDAMPHRVFVKPSRKDEQAELNHSYMVDPDNSYQEFSNYTRRRKRRRNTLARRILGPMILLLAVSGAAWMLLSIRKVPPPPPPVVIDTPNPDPNPIVAPPEPTIWEQIQIEEPTRGIVTGSNVNIRQSHSTAEQIVTKLNAGARVDVLGQWVGVSGTLSGPWFNIRTDGKDGWIYGQYFQPLDGRQATLPRGYTNALLKSFGSDKTELSDQLGQPTRQTPTTMTWAGLTIDLRGNDLVRLQISGPQHVLQNVVTVGMTEEELYKKVGYPSDCNYRTRQLRYIENGDGGAVQGMAVILQNGKIQSITVGNI